MFSFNFPIFRFPVNLMVYWTIWDCYLKILFSFLGGFVLEPRSGPVPSGLTERSDGVLLRLLVLVGLPAGHQRGDGEGVRPRGQLRFGGRRELHVGLDAEITPRRSNPPERRSGKAGVNSCGRCPDLGPLSARRLGASRLDVRSRWTHGARVESDSGVLQSGCQMRGGRLHSRFNSSPPSNHGPGSTSRSPVQRRPWAREQPRRSPRGRSLTTEEPKKKKIPPQMSFCEADRKSFLFTLLVSSKKIIRFYL